MVLCWLYLVSPDLFVYVLDAKLEFYSPRWVMLVLCLQPIASIILKCILSTHMSVGIYIMRLYYIIRDAFSSIELTYRFWLCMFYVLIYSVLYLMTYILKPPWRSTPLYHSELATFLMCYWNLFVSILLIIFLSMMIWVFSILLIFSCYCLYILAWLLKNHCNYIPPHCWRC